MSNVGVCFFFRSNYRIERHMRISQVIASIVCFSCLAAQVALAGTVTYYHVDLLGSPIAATNASGQVIWRETYRPYGERLTNDASSSANQVWYTSRRQDAETGLVYMGARYFDPVVGRFMGIDPKPFDEGQPQSFNRYEYAYNNPFAYVDPDGREPTGSMVLRGYAPPTPPWMRDWRKQAIENVCVECALFPASRLARSLAEGLSSRNEEPGDSNATPIGDTTEAGASLRKIHSEDAMKSGSNRYSYEYWKNKSTDEIVRSLKPGETEALRVKPDGTVMNGNTRVQVLEERGLNVNNLPRETYGGS